VLPPIFSKWRSRESSLNKNFSGAKQEKEGEEILTLERGGRETKCERDAGREGGRERERQGGREREREREREKMAANSRKSLQLGGSGVVFVKWMNLLQVLFCGCTGLFCGYIGLFWHIGL